MQNNQPQILFKQPIKIKDDVEIQIFNDKTDGIQYLLILGERHYIINSFVYKLIQIIYEFSDLENIQIEFSKFQNKQYKTNEIITVINEILVQKEIVETVDIVDNKIQKSFLYFKTPLFSRRILEPITQILQVFFKTNIAFFAIVTIIIAHLYIFFHFNSGQLANVLLNNPYLIVLTILISLLSVIFHEIGHSSACHSMGADFKEIGIGLYLRFPVFYSNITDAWRLSPAKRVVIDIAGIYFQYLFNVVLIVVYLITKQDSIITIIKVICIQTIFTLNPFFRYDGYWVASDLLGVYNLRKKAEEMMVYYTQKFLFRKKSEQKVILHIKPFAKKVFVLYAVISNLFFFLFVYLFIKQIPTIVETIPAIMQETYRILINPNQYSIWEIIRSLYKILIRLFITGFSFFFFYTILLRIKRLIKSTYTTHKYQN